jgi:predicted enzyme related to lactoylglutathione lyase
VPEQFAFTKLVVADLEACHAFYSTVFGFQEIARVTSEIGGRGIDEIMYAPTSGGGASFVLLTFTDLDTPREDEVILGFVTQDIGGLFTRAIQAGAAVVSEPTDMPEHGVRVGFLHDVEGHLIEVVQVLV